MDDLKQLHNDLTSNDTGKKTPVPVFDLESIGNDYDAKTFDFFTNVIDHGSKHDNFGIYVWPNHMKPFLITDGCLHCSNTTRIAISDDLSSFGHCNPKIANLFKIIPMSLSTESIIIDLAIKLNKHHTPLGNLTNIKFSGNLVYANQDWLAALIIYKSGYVWGSHNFCKQFDNESDINSMLAILANNAATVMIKVKQYKDATKMNDLCLIRNPKYAKAIKRKYLLLDIVKKIKKQ